jgi:hypothetical protein
VLELTPDLVGATETRNSGIIGEAVDLNLVHTGDVRPSQVVYELTSHLVLSKWRDANGEPQLHLFGQLKRIARSGWTIPASARAAPTRPSSSTRCWPTWPARRSLPASPAR